jgi:Helix-turn-helix domain
MVDATPLSITVPQACRLSGYGPTTIWALVRDGRLKPVRVPGVRRTLISYQSLVRLLTPSATNPQPAPRQQGRPAKCRPAAGADG